VADLLGILPATDASASSAESAFCAKSGQEPGDARWPAQVGASARVTADLVDRVLCLIEAGAVPDRDVLRAM